MSGIVLGQIASGTNIPTHDPALYVSYVSGGTATVSLTTPIGVTNGAPYIGLSDTTGLVPGMFAKDTTRSAFPSNTYVIGINGNASASLTHLTS